MQRQSPGMVKNGNLLLHREFVTSAARVRRAACRSGWAKQKQKLAHRISFSEDLKDRRARSRGCA
jgi:hypothetical protein